MPEILSQIPERPSLERLRKLAKQRLAVLRETDSGARLADAQFAIAREHGFPTWPQLVAHVSRLDPNESRPQITSPVVRHLGAVDRQRTAAFWRDVLGFELKAQRQDDEIELTYGRARICFVEYDNPPDHTGEGRPPGSAVVFFDTDDIEGMHAAIRQRGGTPTAIEKVNWIKRRVFEVRDPDGHTIWYGQSYHEKSPARSRRMLSRVIPELPVDDVPAAVRHYRDVLGFSVNYEQEDLGVLDRDEIRILLLGRTPEHTGIGSAYFYVRDVDLLYTELVQSGADVLGEPVSQPWGLREFSVRDIARNRLTFGQTFE